MYRHLDSPAACEVRARPVDYSAADDQLAKGSNTPTPGIVLRRCGREGRAHSALNVGTAMETLQTHETP